MTHLHTGHSALHALEHSSAGTPSVFESHTLDWFLVLGGSLVAGITALLALGSAVVTATAPLGVLLSERVDFRTLAEPQWMPEMLLALVIAVVICGICAWLTRHAKRVSERGLVLCLAAISVVFGMWWVVTNATDFNHFPDSAQLVIFARQLATGDTSMFLPHTSAFESKLPGDLYLSEYPFQSGLLLLFIGYAKVFGEHFVSAFQATNVLATSCVAWLLYRCSVTRKRPKGERLVVALLAFSFVPPILFSVFPYGNSIGFALAVGFVYVWMRASAADDARRGVALAALGGVFLLLALIVKPTFLVLGIGALVIWLVDCLRCRAAARAVVGTISFVLAWALSSFLPVAAMEGVLGYELPENAPKSAWIAMGLSNDGALGEGLPGWWSGAALASQIEHNGDVEGQAKDAEASIAASLSRFAADPVYASWFFSKKLASEWLDPAFQSLYLSALGQMRPEASAHGAEAGVDGPVGEGAPEAREGELFDPTDRSRPHGWVVAVLIPYMDGFQTAVYAGAALGALDLVRSLRRRGAAGTKPGAGTEHGVDRPQAMDFMWPCIFFVGFCVYVLWEAKGMYVMPFFTCLIPLAARGLAKELPWARARGMQ